MWAFPVGSFLISRSIYLLQVYSDLLFLLDLVLVVCVFLGICSFCLGYLIIFWILLIIYYFFISVRLVVIVTLPFLIPDFYKFECSLSPHNPNVPPYIKKNGFLQVQLKDGQFLRTLLRKHLILFILFMDHTSLLLCGSHYFC